MEERKICEITDEIVERAIVCPMLIPDLEGQDYCGYYGKDLDGRRLAICKIEEVFARRVGNDTFLGGLK